MLRVDDQIVVHRIHHVGLEVFSDERLAVCLRSHHLPPRLLIGDLVSAHHVLNPRLQRRNDEQAKAYLLGEDVACATPDDDCMSVGPDGADDLREMLEVFIGPHVVFTQDGDPFVKDAAILLVEGFNDLLASLGIRGDFLDDFVVEKIDFQVLGKFLGQGVTHGAGQPGHGDDGPDRVFVLFLLVGLPSLDLLLDDLVERALRNGSCFHDVASLFDGCAPPARRAFPVDKRLLMRTLPDPKAEGAAPVCYCSFWDRRGASCLNVIFNSTSPALVRLCISKPPFSKTWSMGSLPARTSAVKPSRPCRLAR